MPWNIMGTTDSFAGTPVVAGLKIPLYILCGIPHGILIINRVDRLFYWYPDIRCWAVGLACKYYNFRSFCMSVDHGNPTAAATAVPWTLWIFNSTTTAYLVFVTVYWLPPAVGSEPAALAVLPHGLGMVI
jgi:hypothetical protein